MPLLSRLQRTQKRSLIMSNFDDFDLDITNVASNSNSDGATPYGITSGIFCGWVTTIFIDSLFESCATCAANPLSCDCSMSDMTSCDICQGDAKGAGLARC